METDNFKKIISELVLELQNYKYQGDLADIGDIVGRIIGKYIVDDKNSSYNYSDFIAGLKHGISIANGTH